MALTPWPVAGTGVNAADWYTYQRLVAAGDGVANLSEYANYFEVYGDSSGRQVKIKTGLALCGSVAIQNTAEITLSLTTNSTGSTRYDGIFLEIDYTTKIANVVAVVGDTTTTGPALTQTSSKWQIRLAVVTLTDGYTTVAAGDVTDRRAFNVGRDFKQRIAKWASVPACRVYPTSDSTLSNNTTTAVAMGSEHFDTDTMHSTTTNNSRITFNTSGIYAIGGCGNFDNDASGQRQVSIRVNGGGSATSVMVPVNSSANNTIINVSALYAFAAGDYIELTVWQNSGGSLTFRHGSGQSSQLWAYFVGPANN